VTTDQTLADIRDSINKAAYATGKEVVASLIDGKLVLESKNSGTAYSIDYTGASSGTILSDLGMTNLQTATDAEFSVNGIFMTRSKNNGLDDVVSGLTVNLGALVGSGTLFVVLVVTVSLGWLGTVAGATATMIGQIAEVWVLYGLTMRERAALR
jgi:flagellar capping protein FliD